MDTPISKCRNCGHSHIRHWTIPGKCDTSGCTCLVYVSPNKELWSADKETGTAYTSDSDTNGGHGEGSI